MFFSYAGASVRTCWHPGNLCIKSIATAYAGTSAGRQCVPQPVSSSDPLLRTVRIPGIEPGRPDWKSGMLP